MTTLFNIIFGAIFLMLGTVAIFAIGVPAYFLAASGRAVRRGDDGAIFACMIFGTYLLFSLVEHLAVW